MRRPACTPRADDAPDRRAGTPSRCGVGQQEALDRGAEVLGPDGPAVGEAQPATEREDVGPAVGARRRRASWRARRRASRRRRPRPAGTRRGRRRRASRAAQVLRSCTPSGCSQSIGTSALARGRGRAACRRDGRTAARPRPPTPSRRRPRARPGCCRSCSRLSHARPARVDADDACRPRRPPPTPSLRPTATARRVGAHAHGPGHGVASSGSIRESVPSWRLTTHTAPSPTRQRARPVADVDRLDDRAGARVDARDGARLLARHPQRARAGRERRRVRARSGSARDAAAVEVDAPRRGPRRRMRPTARPPGERQRARRVADRDLTHDLVGRPGRPARPTRPSPSATHSEPPPNASAAGAPPTGIVTISSRSRSMRVTVPSAALAIHTDPPPADDRARALADRVLRGDAAGVRGRSARRRSRRCRGARRARGRG